jgi:hypothetical protein
MKKKLNKKISKIEDIIDIPSDIFTKPITVFYIIIDYLLVYNDKEVVDKNIDFFIKSYLNNSVGNPNSI